MLITIYGRFSPVFNSGGDFLIFCDENSRGGMNSRLYAWLEIRS